jgi:agmatinase
VPRATRFLAAKAGPAGRAGLLGAALDLTESYRSGTRAAPARIRAASDALETYSPPQDRDLEDVAFGDWGDVDLGGLSMPAALDAVEQRFGAVLARGFGVLLGGEHTLALAGFRAARRLHPEAALIQFDAHLDIRDEYEGERAGHATWVRRVGEQFGFECIVQLGIRSGTREEFRLARERCLYSSSGLELPAWVLEHLSARAVYVSVDIDVLDPGAAPGTGCPEPGGVTFRDLQESLYRLAPLRVVGADLCEVLPDNDPADVTAICAAKLVRELVLLFGR